MKTECLLATLAGSTDTERLAVVLVGRKVSLRQQSWADGIGWYDQKSLELEPAQLRQLRAFLGTGTSGQAAVIKFPDPHGQTA